MEWIVDGMNVIGSRPDGWWRDRVGARDRLVRELGEFSRRCGDPVAVVFDGPDRPEAEVTGVTVSFAAGGPNAADRSIAALVRALDDPGGTTVVTSDADLARRVRAGGAVVLGAAGFCRLLEARPG